MWMKSIGILCFPPPILARPAHYLPKPTTPNNAIREWINAKDNFDAICTMYIYNTIFKEQLLNKLYNWNHLLRRWWCETLAFCSIFFLLHNFIIKLGYLIMVNLNILCSLYDTTIVLIPIHNQLFMKSVSTRALQFQYNY